MRKTESELTQGRWLSEHGKPERNSKRLQFATWCLHDEEDPGETDKPFAGRERALDFHSRHVAGRFEINGGLVKI